MALILADSKFVEDFDKSNQNVKPRMSTNILSVVHISQLFCFRTMCLENKTFDNFTTKVGNI